MRVVAFVPIKLTNQRLPGKNLLPLGGKPLCQHIFESLLKVDEIDEVFAYCSNERLIDYLPEGVTFLKRGTHLDGDLVKGLDIYKEFVRSVDADVYVLAHATSPLVKSSTIQLGVSSVLTGSFDSAFSAQRLQTFAWYEGKPLNYSLTDIPRTQDIEPVWVETSAFYIFKKNVMTEWSRRIGDLPKIIEVSGAEAIDIDEAEDYEIAKRMMGDVDE